ncbi:MAG: hypothetical protein H6Q72_4707 [Firmicutes bacterium]|nr:hypothetical protein [Bacillota bacterium]
MPNVLKLLQDFEKVNILVGKKCMYCKANADGFSMKHYPDCELKLAIDDLSPKSDHAQENQVGAMGISATRRSDDADRQRRTSQTLIRALEQEATGNVK